MSGIERIARERTRQIAEEGYTPEYDAGRAKELLDAACCYAWAAATQEVVRATIVEASAEHPEVLEGMTLEEYTTTKLRGLVHLQISTQPPPPWPWEVHYWKPSPDPVRNAEKAGALMAAALDSLTGEPGTIPAQHEAIEAVQRLAQENIDHLDEDAHGMVYEDLELVESYIRAKAPETGADL